MDVDPASTDDHVHRVIILHAWCDATALDRISREHDGVPIPTASK